VQRTTSHFRGKRANMSQKVCCRTLQICKPMEVVYTVVTTKPPPPGTPAAYIQWLYLAANGCKTYLNLNLSLTCVEIHPQYDD
jgi:hypothetical protein